MQNEDRADHRVILDRIARRAMLERGLLPDYSKEALAELETLSEAEASAASPAAGPVRDMRALPWCSIDNEDSRDLDQLTAGEVAGEGWTVYAAIADVDRAVKDGSAIDAHARHNASTVYAASSIFNMLPERLSFDLTSLNQDRDRPALVIELGLGADGSIIDSDVYRATVRNMARLSYGDVAAWLEGRGPMPAGLAAVPGLEAALRAQDAAALALKASREARGSLDFGSKKYQPVFEGALVSGMRADRKDRAKEFIENVMVAANGAVARFLFDRGFPVLRRVVRTPKRWERIVALAGERGTVLPPAADPRALSAFLSSQRLTDPQGFPDLSLAVIKLLGAGEYVAQMPNEAAEGHFGLAVRDYAHSTAPNRRYPDLITHRLIKAALDKVQPPYEAAILQELAAHCTERENAVNKVERQVGKSAAALFLQGRIGESFEAVVTGAAEKGTWLRLKETGIEGRLSRGHEGLDVGDPLRARLMSVDVERGYLDFERAD